MRRVPLMLGTLVVATVARVGRADTELGVAAGSAVFDSTWRGDYAGGATLRAGARFEHVIAADLQVWESYATVNHREDTGLSIGATGYLPLRVIHPYLRLFVLHQHEEGWVSVANQPAGFLFGIGAGIRHRAGTGGCLGVEIPFRDSVDKRLQWSLFTEVTYTYFFSSALGPTAYVGLDVGVGLDWLLR